MIFPIPFLKRLPDTAAAWWFNLETRGNVEENTGKHTADNFNQKMLIKALLKISLVLHIRNQLKFFKQII